MLTDIFAVRHGHPLQNTGLAYHTLPGPGLSDQGRQEAHAAGEFLAAKQVEHIFVSPFDRTAQTAEQILEVVDIPITFTRLVQEHGPGENFEQVRSRIRELLAGAEDSPLQRIALVSHGSPIRALLHELSNDTIDLSGHNYPGGNPAPTAGIWHARRSDNGWQIELAFRPAQ